jgi:hypothetical protein
MLMEVLEQSVNTTRKPVFESHISVMLGFMKHTCTPEMVNLIILQGFQDHVR